MNAALKGKQTLNLPLQPRHTWERYLVPNTLRSPFGQSLPGFGQSVPGVEAVMAHVLHELLLYCCLAAFVTGIVLIAATLIS